MTALTLDDFAGHVGGTFHALAGETEHALVLETADALPSSARAGGGFSLVFRGPREPVLEQSIYALRSDGRTDEIFIVPIGQDADGTRYEAVFF